MQPTDYCLHLRNTGKAGEGLNVDQFFLLINGKKSVTQDDVESLTQLLWFVTCFLNLKVQRYIYLTLVFDSSLFCWCSVTVCSSIC